MLIFAYLGPGIGIGGLVVLIGLGFTFLFLLYAFVYLPIRNAFRRNKDQDSSDAT